MIVVLPSDSISIMLDLLVMELYGINLLIILRQYVFFFEELDVGSSNLVVGSNYKGSLQALSGSCSSTFKFKG